MVKCTNLKSTNWDILIYLHICVPITQIKIENIFSILKDSLISWPSKYLLSNHYSLTLRLIFSVFKLSNFQTQNVLLSGFFHVTCLSDYPYCKLQYSVLVCVCVYTIPLHEERERERECVCVCVYYPTAWSTVSFSVDVDLCYFQCWDILTYNLCFIPDQNRPPPWWSSV